MAFMRKFPVHVSTDVSIIISCASLVYYFNERGLDATSLSNQISQRQLQLGSIKQKKNTLN